MLENRRYEDYEELGRYIKETLNALQPLEGPDLHRAEVALKEVADKAFAMWGDEPTMQTTLTDLRNLHEVVLGPRVEQSEPAAPMDTAYLVDELLWNLRGRFQEAFEREGG